MTETPSAQNYGWRTSQDTRDEERLSDRRALARADYERAGWVNFAAIVLLVLGAFQVINGLTAIFRSGTYVVGPDRLLVDVDYTAWGWVHLATGVLAGAAGLGVLRGQTWARIVGIGIALVSAVVNLVFIPAYPFLAIMVITLDVIAIYGIAVHGATLEKGRY